MNPKYSVISVGKNNRYGHPNKEVLNKMSDSNEQGKVQFKFYVLQSSLTHLRIRNQ